MRGIRGSSSSSLFSKEKRVYVPTMGTFVFFFFFFDSCLSWAVFLSSLKLGLFDTFPR